jgi:hypothetical protein
MRVFLSILVLAGLISKLHVGCGRGLAIWAATMGAGESTCGGKEGEEVSAILFAKDTAKHPETSSAAVTCPFCGATAAGLNAVGGTSDSSTVVGNGQPDLAFRCLCALTSDKFTGILVHPCSAPGAVQGVYLSQPPTNPPGKSIVLLAPQDRPTRHVFYTRRNTLDRAPALHSRSTL